jgi:hypothetical protein
MATSSWNPPTTAQVGEQVDLDVTFVSPGNTATEHLVTVDGTPIIQNSVADIASDEIVLTPDVGFLPNLPDQQEFNSDSSVSELNGNLVFNEPGTYTLTIDDPQINESQTVSVTEPAEPNISIIDCSTPNSAVVGEAVTTTATLTNSGDADGTATVAVFVDGGEIERTSQPVAAGGQGTVGFELTFQSPTEASVSVELV